MRLVCLVCSLIIVCFVGSLFAVEHVSPVLSETPVYYPAGHVIEINQLSSIPARNLDELNDYLGDTLHLGNTYHDLQHNATVGRMVQYDPYGDEGNGMTHCVFTRLLQPLGTDREVMYGKVVYDEIPQLHEGMIFQVNPGDRAGFVTLAMSPTAPNPLAMPAYHGRMNADQDFNTQVAIEYEFWPGAFIENSVPWDEDYQLIWPKSAMDGDSVLHVMSTTSGSPEGEQWYSRFSIDRDFPIAEMTNPGYYPELIFDDTEFISGDIACSPDGQRVAISALVNKAWINGDWEYTSGLNKELLIWTNEERGLDWDWELGSAFNVTNFIPPDPDLQHDSTEASQDTFRVYLDCNLYFDHDNVLHAAFSTLEYFYFYRDPNGEYGAGYVTSQLWYWNELDNYAVRIADGDYWLYTALGSNNITVQRPSIYKDPVTGWIYILYQHLGVPGDAFTAEDAPDSTWIGIGRDRSEMGFLNAELFMTASPPFTNSGRLWLKGVNITESRGTSGAIPAGESAHERDPSISLNNDGDYLHLFYMKDEDPGVHVFGGDGSEGEATFSPMVYQRINKLELQDMLWTQAEWVRGYPLHIDSSYFWIDPEDWVFTDGVREDTYDKLMPEDFSLSAIYPNPFNSTTRIRINLNKPGNMVLKVYDILGREVAVLLDNVMTEGTHEIRFDAGDLSSGIYFVNLESGGMSKTRKIVLMR